ncbi:maestro heat-like repeat-containing protein family member 7 [Dromaius novaehollandiae]|uniref:maestro heat-like repeat-containing protein family member 7 n=1 Tax=Dromaius novaehollandiae TaxID=8790 RepID=UPI00311DB998
MWRVLLSKPMTAEKVLGKLFHVLLDWPVHKASTLDGDHMDISPLTATMALQEILQWPPCPPQVEAFFPQLFLALLFQISVTAALTPEEAEMCWRECRGEESALTSPVRAAVRAMKALLCRAGYERQVLLMARKGGWDMLLRAETHHSGVALLAREMRETPRSLRVYLLRQLAVLLRLEEPSQEISILAFLVELVDCPDLCEDNAHILLLLARYLERGSQVIRGLVLRGLILLCDRPQTVREMRFLLPLIMEQLRDADSDISTKALVVLRHVVHVTGEETVASIAPQLSAELLLLFDARRQEGWARGRPWAWSSQH